MNIVTISLIKSGFTKHRNAHSKWHFLLSITRNPSYQNIVNVIVIAHLFFANSTIFKKEKLLKCISMYLLNTMLLKQHNSDCIRNTLTKLYIRFYHCSENEITVLTTFFFTTINLLVGGSRKSSTTKTNATFH